MYSFPVVLFSWSDFNGKSFHLFHPVQIEKVKILQKLDSGKKKKEGLGC